MSRRNQQRTMLCPGMGGVDPALPPSLSLHDRARLTEALRRCTVCFLCQAPAAYREPFVPSRPALWGGMPGKGRAFAYGLCVGCFHLGNKTDLVEGKLQAGLGARRN